MYFCELFLDQYLPQKFCHTHRQTNRHFPDIVNYSGHPKTCKSIKNRMSKISKRQIFFLVKGKRNFFDHSYHSLGELNQKQ